VEPRFTGTTAVSLISQADIAESASYGSRARLRRADPDCGRRWGAVLAGSHQQDASSSSRSQLPMTDVSGVCPPVNPASPWPLDRTATTTHVGAPEASLRDRQADT
jgi:hypothetical protein